MRWQLKRRLLELRAQRRPNSSRPQTNDRSIYYGTTRRGGLPPSAPTLLRNEQKAQAEKSSQKKSKRKKTAKKPLAELVAAGKTRRDGPRRGKLRLRVDSTLLYGQCKPLNWTRLVLVVAVAFLSLTKRFCLTHSSGPKVGRLASTWLDSTLRSAARLSAAKSNLDT